MKDKTLIRIFFILLLTVLTGIFFNLSNPRGISFIGEERRPDFSASDSLMNVLRLQDSIQRTADSLALLSGIREDSLRSAEEKRIHDSIIASNRQDSLRRIQDSLKSIEVSSADSVKNSDVNKNDYIKPVDIRINFAKALFDKNYTFIDSRDVPDYNAGRIKGAVNIPFKEIEKHKSRLESMAKDRVYVVYCSAACDVSIDMAYYMAKMGFRKVYIFHGGWDEWRDAGYPSE